MIENIKEWPKKDTITIENDDTFMLTQDALELLEKTL